MLQLRKQRNQKGFTLVEIAIVLVIVGLILFGVLKGKEMVNAGKAKKTISQVEGLRAAITTYTNKYSGKYPGMPGGATIAGDALDAFTDLNAGGFINYNSTDGMKNGFGGIITAVYAAGTGVTITNKGVPSYIATRLDTDADDGNPGTGDIQYTAGTTADELIDTLVIIVN